VKNNNPRWHGISRAVRRQLYLTVWLWASAPLLSCAAGQGSEVKDGYCLFASTNLAAWCIVPFDAQARLQDNLEGFDWLVAQLDRRPVGARPIPRSWRNPD
jgi:hypothetical protein